MKKKIRLTEDELVSLVKRVIKEQEDRPEVDDNEVVEVSDKIVRIKNASSDTVQRVLSDIPQGVYFIKIHSCESADFSEVDVCSLLRLLVVTIVNTPSNFEDVVDCPYEKLEKGGKIQYDMSVKEDMGSF